MNMTPGFTCPACGKPMQQIKICETELEACINGCGGIWFDSAELFRVDDMGKGDNEPDLQRLLEFPRQNNSESRDKLLCIKCGIKMRRREYRESSQIFVDECYDCGSIWLDGGELKAIRENPAVLRSNQERTQMAADHARKVQEDKRLAELERELRSRRRHQF